MLSLEICQRLKAAGYPQPEPQGTGNVYHGRYIYRWRGKEYVHDFQGRYPEKKWAACPTLSDLISQLKDVQLFLYRITPVEHDTWIAGIRTDEGMTAEFAGKNAEEACAKLYLALKDAQMPQDQ